MKRTIINTVALLVLVFVLVPGSIMAAGEKGLGLSNGHDLDDLWAKVQANHDLEIEDALLLLESRQITFTDAEEIQTRIHRVVWVGTAVGIRSYADLRIPWNTETSDLEVEVLRTWRDGRWWPDVEKISDTAVVHTLPHALDKADDYTTMRETMLLHDGVELGCIMETVYTITERGVPARGGIFVIPQRDPSVLTELKVTAPSSMEIRHEEVGGISAPSTLDENLTTTLLWRWDNSKALKKPTSSHPETCEPTVIWSSWKDWQSLANYWNAQFSNAAILDPEQIDPFMKELYPTMSSWEKVAAVGDYLNEMVNRTHYNDKFWQLAPRPAARTLSTAYGHDLDRAVLAAALLKEAGLEFSLNLVSNGVSLVSPNIPRLQDLDRIEIQIPDATDAILNPNTGKIVGRDEYLRHPGLSISADNASDLVPHQVLPNDTRFEMALSLEPGSDNTWQGSGSFQATNYFSPYSRVIAEDDLASGYVSSLATSVIPGIEVTRARPIAVAPKLVNVTFGLKIGEPDDDAAEITKLVIGAPAAGIASKIPRDVHLYEATRSTPITGLYECTQVVTVRIKVEPEQVVHRPEPKSIHNKAGSFELEVLEEDGWLSIVRTVKLTHQVTIPASDWPDLRVLLLEEADPVNGTVWLK